MNNNVLIFFLVFFAFITSNSSTHALGKRPVIQNVKADEKLNPANASFITLCESNNKTTFLTMNNETKDVLITNINGSNLYTGLSNFELYKNKIKLSSSKLETIAYEEIMNSQATEDEIFTEIYFNQIFSKFDTAKLEKFIKTFPKFDFELSYKDNEYSGKGLLFIPNNSSAIEMNCINTKAENLPNTMLNIKNYKNIKNDFLGFIAKSKRFVQTCAALMNESTRFKCSEDKHKNECTTIASEIKRSCNSIYNQEQIQISQKFRFTP